MTIEKVRHHYRRFGMQAIAPKAWGEEFEIKMRVDEAAPPPPFNRVGPLAVVDVSGPLVHRSHWAWDSYEGIVARVAAAFDSDAEAVVMRIDSPGGDVEGCFDAARTLRALAAKQTKPLLAFADGMAASAAYALACAASRIIVSPTSSVGSIGIIEGMRDQTVADAAMGQRFAIIASGEHKADGNPHVPITEKALANLQSQVDGMAQLFFGLVEELRGFPAAKAKALEARMLFGANAVAAKLADEVLAWSSLAHGTVPKSAHVGLAKPAARSKGKAMNLKQHMAWAAEHGDDEEKEAAKKCLAALDGDGDGKDEKKDGDGEKDKAEGKKAEAEPEKRVEKAEGKKAEAEEKKADAKSKAGYEKEDEKEAEGKKAHAAHADTLALAARVHRLEAEKAEQADAEKRSALLAKRPDFSPEIVATLAKASIAQLEEAVKTWPRIGSKLGNAAAASQATGTRGRAQGGAPSIHDDRPLSNMTEAQFIDRKMGFEVELEGITETERGLSLGPMTPAQAQAFLKNRSAEKGGV
jgi:ClpP class serine protease